MIPLWILFALLLLGVAIGYAGVNDMLDNLRPGAYANLFSMALSLRAGLCDVIAIVAMAWY
jgi:hypothetical protein